MSSSIIQKVKDLLKNQKFSSVSEFKFTITVATGNPLANIKKLPPFLALELFNSILYIWYTDIKTNNLIENLILFIEEKYIDLKALDINEVVIWLKHSGSRHPVSPALHNLLEKIKKKIEKQSQTIGYF